jgi:hypothetical protein
MLDLEAFLKEFNIPDDWSILLIGDGSGSVYAAGIGWAGVMLDRATGRWITIAGAQTNGTVTIAEIYPYWQLLRYHKYQIHKKDREKPYKVFGFCDNESVVKCINNLELPWSNHDYWEAFKQIKTPFYDVQFVHLPRDTNHLHILMDQVSVSAREYIQNLSTELLPDIYANVKV